MYCKYCGKPLDPMIKFCLSCGKDQPYTPSNPNIFCPGCGEGVAENQRFCHNCGKEQGLFEKSGGDIVAYNYKERKAPVYIVLLLCAAAVVMPFMKMFAFDFSMFDVKEQPSYSFVSISDIGSDITSKNITGSRTFDDEDEKAAYPMRKLNDKYNLGLYDTDASKIEMSPSIVTVITVFYVITLLAYVFGVIHLIIAFVQLVPNDSDLHRLYSSARSSIAFFIFGNLMQLGFAIIINRAFLSAIGEMNDKGMKIAEDPMIRTDTKFFILTGAALLAYFASWFFLTKDRKFYKVKYFGKNKPQPPQPQEQTGASGATIPNVQR
ncbi:MAG: zinc ribbon domain-containing protein [Ruminococcus sp.]|nr:zinc ribbon domain-containing protein [Ruminococcus sp.]